MNREIHMTCTTQNNERNENNKQRHQNIIICRLLYTNILKVHARNKI